MRKKKRIQKTPRKKLEKKLETLITERLFAKYGPICQLCKKPYKINMKSRRAKGLGQFHVLPKGGLWANLKYDPRNILWAGWYCCHYPFHHDYYRARDIIIPRLKEILGDDYEDKLKRLSRCIGRLSMAALEAYYEYWDKKFLKEQV